MQKKEEIQAQQPFAHWLNGVEGIGGAWARRLVDAFGTPEEVYRADEKSLLAVAGGSRMEELRKAQKREVYEAYERMERDKISFIPYYHPDYPKRLLQIPDSPFGIYVKGEVPKDSERSVAIVGARSCSAYGRYVADAFARELAREGVAVVSGMARGIDGVAQKGALAAGGRTYAVLGCGVDICYPASHAKLYEEISRAGGILSTYPPGTAPTPKHFPPRNRIISGLSDAVLVVEARQKSGTLITVDMALEQGREVYAVPGRVTDRLSDGCNGLLLQGAGAALSPAQVVKELSETVWRDRRQKKGQKEDTYTEGIAGAGNRETGYTEAGNRETEDMAEENPSAERVGGQERALLSLLDFYPISMEQIYMMAQTEKLLCGLKLPQLMELLLKLAAKGMVADEGGYYGLKKPI